jgi:L-ascorbate metabolism protein UlaG (beta-lactamase superfamily)
VDTVSTDDPGLALTWWGHAFSTLELGATRVALDPLLSDRLFHLRRYAVGPTDHAADADLVLVSHLHHDHLHRPSLHRFPPGTPLVLPRGGEQYLGAALARHALPVAPGDKVEVAGVRVEVLPASHDGRRHPWSRTAPPALGFRLTDGRHTAWFPGDTSLRDDMRDVAPVDLALVPVGGWGPTLVHGHMDPEHGAEAVARVGARWAAPVHWGTFWPRGLRHVAKENHRHLFHAPGERFADALRERSPETEPVPLAHGVRRVLAGG